MIQDKDFPMSSLPCHMPGYEDPCVDCPLNHCPMDPDPDQDQDEPERDRRDSAVPDYDDPIYQG